MMTLGDHSKNMNVIDSAEIAKGIRKTHFMVGNCRMDYTSEA